MDRRFAHDAWMEEMKRKAFLEKLVDLGDEAAYLDRSAAKEDQIPTAQK